jgi:hypothetical protein
MPKLQLKLSPTFKAHVDIPVPGARPAKVEFTFKARDREELADWLAKLDGKKTDEAVLEIASGWDLEDAFDQANVEVLLRTYIGAWQAIYQKYLDELMGARAKN